MIIIFDGDEAYWLSKDYTEYSRFENYCLLISNGIDYSPKEYGIKGINFEKGFIFPKHYDLNLLQLEEQALIEYAKIKDEKIELYRVGHRNNDPEQGQCLYPYEPADGDRVFGKDS